MMLRICVVGSNQDPSKPVSMSLYIAHRACTAFAGKDLGRNCMQTLTDTDGLNLSQPFVLANNRSSAYDGEFVLLKVKLQFATDQQQF